MIKTLTRLSLATALLASAGLAQAIPTTFTYTLDDVSLDPLSGQEPKGGLITAIETTYTPNEQRFTWSHTIAPNADGTPSNGFWLVVSDGDNPKGDADEYAILFGDLTNKRLSAYLYNGKNSSNSWRNPGVYLESFDTDLVVTPGSNATTVSFDIDVAGINSLDVNNIPGYPNYQPKPQIDWDGITFGRKLGIWFHPTAGSTFEYDANGKITRFKQGSAGWLDGKNFTTNRVPEPGILYLVGLGLLAFSLSRALFARRRTDGGMPAAPALAV